MAVEQDLRNVDVLKPVFQMRHRILSKSLLVILDRILERSSDMATGIFFTERIDILYTYIYIYVSYIYIYIHMIQIYIVFQ